MLSNDWHDNERWPDKSGEYYVIAVFHVDNANASPDLIVKDGDTIIDTDYFDVNSYDWKNNPFEHFSDGWEIVAWKKVLAPMLPYEFRNAVLFSDISQRLAKEA